MSYEPALNDPVSNEPSYWRCGGCNEYFHPEQYDWHVDEECKQLLEEDSE